MRKRFDALEAGAETGESVFVAGRLRTTRGHGKVAFADLEDPSGRLQLFAHIAVLGDDGMERFARLNVGDVVGVSGEVVKTRRGELSIRVADVTVLAPCLRPMPDSWHGMSDVEARHRQRHLDLIVNPEARRPLWARAEANATVRAFLRERGFVEVETPLLHPVAGGAVARPFVTHHNALDIDLYLRIAPELYLKRLLIGGVDKVFELDRSFRNEGISARHNPEYTMLEAYEAYVDYNDTMALVESLVRAVTVAVAGSLRVGAGAEPIDFEPPFRRVTMFEAIAEHSGRDLEDAWAAGDEGAVRSHAEELGVRVAPGWGPGKVVAEIFEAVAEHELRQPTFVVGWPKEVSPLAKDHRTIEGFTEQADLVIRGIEMCPVYSELNDPEEQRKRFEQQAAARSAGDQEATLPDEDFLEALAYGMPPAGGFGLGMDRLLTVLLGAASLRETILFPTLRPEA
ncbi:lysine--tRNA ligase [soil metagenome]